MALLETLVDNFNAPSRDARFWTQFTTGTATIAVTNGQIVCTPPSSTAGSNYSGFDSLRTDFDLTGSYASIQIAQAVNAAVGAQQYLKLVKDASNNVQWVLENGTLKPQKTVGGSQTDITAGVTFNATTHAFIRTRESGGNMFFDFSSDDETWTNHTSLANPFTITAMQVEFACGTYQSVVSPGVGIFDNFNTDGIVHGTTTSTSSTSASTFSTSSTSSSLSTSSTSFSSTSTSLSTSSTSYSMSITTMSTSSTSSSISSTSASSTSASTSQSSTSSSISSTSQSSTSRSTTSSSTSQSSTSSSFSSTSSSQSSTSRSTSSTSASSTSSSSSTSTTAIPSNLIYSYEDRAPTTVVVQFGQTSTWTCPANVSSVQVECWGGGGGGGGLTVASNIGGAGGGGGAYSSLNSLSVTPGTSYAVTVGAGGLGKSDGVNGANGGDTSFSSSATVLAKGGGGGATGNPGTAGTGGAAGSGIGDITKSGGAGGSTGGATFGGGGGGGAAGNLANGRVGANGTAGAAGAAGGSGAVLGGRGGAGDAASGNGGNGLAIGGGGGGCGTSGSSGGNGANGFVQLTYTTISLPTTGSGVTNAFTSPLVANVSGDDGDYFVEFGSDYMIREYKKDWTNNTDTPTFTWRGRTTESTVTSPMLIQIYNVNSGAWETLAVANKVPADTDFSVTVTQSANVSNYYDASNIVTFRSYQQVI